MATSQNGWTVIESGTDSRLAKIDKIIGRVRAGDVATIFAYLVARFDAEVEDVDVGADDWGWAYRAIRGTSTGYSNHASGTAIDLNAARHVLGRRGTFTTAQQAALRRILSALGGVVRWGGDYSGRVDEMHFEIVASAVAVAVVAARIRSNGGGVITDPPPTPAPVPPATVPEEDPAAMTADFIIALYWKGMRRAPTPADIDAHLLGMIDWVIDGATVAQALRRKRDEILLSPEALAYTIRRAYQDGLGRQPDPVGAATYLDAIRAGKIAPTAQAVIADLYRSAEGKAWLARTQADRDAAIAVARKTIPAYRTA